MNEIYKNASKEDLIKHIEELQEIVSEKENRKTTNWFWSDKPEKDSTYYSISKDGEVMPHGWYNFKIDEHIYKIGNAFLTKEAAKKEIERRKVRRELELFAKAHNEGALDWSDVQKCKYFIMYDYPKQYFCPALSYSSRSIGNVYFTSQAIAQKAIDTIGKNRLKLLLLGDEE